MNRPSVNTEPPFFGPGLPVYPVRRHLVRVVAAAGAVYSGFMQQWDGAHFRDREPVRVWEPNGVPVPPGIYRARLVSSHDGFPLLITTLSCCVPASSFSSVSTSPSSSSAPSSSSSVKSSSSAISSIASALSSSASPLCCVATPSELCATYDPCCGDLPPDLCATYG